MAMSWQNSKEDRHGTLQRLFSIKKQEIQSYPQDFEGRIKCLQERDTIAIRCNHMHQKVARTTCQRSFYSSDLRNPKNHIVWYSSRLTLNFQNKSPNLLAIVNKWAEVSLLAWQSKHILLVLYCGGYHWYSTFQDSKPMQIMLSH